MGGRPAAGSAAPPSAATGGAEEARRDLESEIVLCVHSWRAAAGVACDSQAVVCSAAGAPRPTPGTLLTALYDEPSHRCFSETANEDSLPVLLLSRVPVGEEGD